MTMVNLRTLSAIGSDAVTGFALGWYAVGTVGPLLGGLLSSAPGSWTVPLVVFAATAIPMALGAYLFPHSGNFEDRVECKRT